MARQRLIVDCDGVSPEEALVRLAAVVCGGRVSTAAGVGHYCWLSRFHDGVEVVTRRKKTEAAADSFLVRKCKV